MTFDYSKVGDVHVIVPKKNLLGRNETADLLAKIDEVAAAETPKVLVDLGKIDYINSTGLGALVRARTTCINRQGWFRIARVGDRINGIFLVTKLVLIFDTYETVEEALAAPHDKAK